MKIPERIGWQGRIRATIWTHPPEAADCPACRLATTIPRACPRHQPYLTGRRESSNLIVTAGRNALRDSLVPAAAEIGIRYMAWGTGTGAPDAADTALGAETGRKAITDQTPGATGVMVTTVYLAPEEAVGTLAELGWFAGTAATGTPGSGILLSRVLYPGGSEVKDSTESIQIDRTDTVN